MALSERSYGEHPFTIMISYYGESVLGDSRYYRVKRDISMGHASPKL